MTCAVQHVAVFDQQQYILSAGNPGEESRQAWAQQSMVANGQAAFMGWLRSAESGIAPCKPIARATLAGISTLEAGAVPLYSTINEGVLGSLVRWDRCRHSNALVHVMFRFHLSPHAACFSTPKAKRRVAFVENLRGFARDVWKLRCTDALTAGRL